MTWLFYVYAWLFYVYTWLFCVYIWLFCVYTWLFYVYTRLIDMTWIIFTCDLTYLHVWHTATHCIYTDERNLSSFMCDLTHSYVWRDSFTCMTWLIHLYDMSLHMHYMNVYFSTIWEGWFFLKVTFIVILYSTFGRALPFENYYQHRWNTTMMLKSLCDIPQRHCNNTATTLQHMGFFAAPLKRDNDIELTLSHTAQTLQQHCNNTATKLQHTGFLVAPLKRDNDIELTLQHTATTLQQHCNKTATHGIFCSAAETRQWYWTHSATHYNSIATTLQQHCNKTATHGISCRAVETRQWYWTHSFRWGLGVCGGRSVWRGFVLQCCCSAVAVLLQCCCSAVAARCVEVYCMALCCRWGVWVGCSGSVDAGLCCRVVAVCCSMLQCVVLFCVVLWCGVLQCAADGALMLVGAEV